MAVHDSEQQSAEQGQRLTVVANRVCSTTGQLGPRVVFNETTGVSLMVTRALGDPMAASAIVAIPEHSFKIVPPASRSVRACVRACVLVSFVSIFFPHSPPEKNKTN